MGLLAELFVKIGARDAALKASLAGIRTQLGTLAASGLGVGTALGSGLARGLGIGLGGLGFAGIGIGLAKAVTGASDFNESLSKTKVIMGEGAEAIIQDADRMAQKFGTVRTEYMDMASNFGGLLQGMAGMTQKESGAMSVALVKVASDSKSMFNTSFANAGEKIASALRGETEPIRALNVDVSEHAVLQELMNTKVKKVSGEFTTQQKVIARSAIIFRKLHVAMGDEEATMDGFANASKGAFGRIQNTLDAFGKALLPVTERFLGGFNRMMGGLENWVNINKGMFERWSENIAAAFRWVGWAAGEVAAAIGDAFARVWAEIESWTGFTTAVSDAWHWLVRQIKGGVDTIGLVWRNWSLIMEYTGILIMGKVANIGEAFSWLVGVAATFGGYLANNWVELIRDAATGAWTILDNLGKNIGNLFYAVWEAIQGNGFHFEFTPILDGFKKMAADIPVITAPAFSSVADQLQVVTDKMNVAADKRLDAIDRAKGAGKPDAAKPNARPGALGPEKDVAKEKKLETTDLAGYFKNLQEGVLGGNNPAARTAKATEETAKAVTKLVAKKPVYPDVPGYTFP